MRKTFFPVLMLSLISVSSTAIAAAQVKPGLWEVTTRSDAMKNAPKISPEQAAQMRKLGIDITKMQDDGITTRTCLTKEMAERDQPIPVDQKETGCQTKNMQKNGNTYSMDIVCNSAEMKGEGKAKGSYSGGENFTATYAFKGIMSGHPVNQHSDTTGKWLGADCGNVKPVSDYLKKK